jgi:uncharacterized SAM-binding protein YcdF (DUF218 family)
LLVSLWLLAWIAARSLILEVPLDHADAIIVLSGSSTLRERAALAAELYRAGKAPQIILTNDGGHGGWSQAEQRNPQFFELTSRALQSGGVPASSIRVLPQIVSSTHDEALLLRQVCEQKRLGSLLVVTSAYHSRRALWTFQRVFAGSGVKVGLKAVPVGIQTPNTVWWWLHPRGWAMVPTEYAKLLVYRLTY